MGSILGILTLVGLVVLPVVAFLYGARALRWGMHYYPRTTRTAVVVLLTLPILAACTFGRLFPGCYEAHVGGFAIPIGDCRPH